MYKLKKQAFTLVELIVVIIILAILGTIAYISMQSYSAHARDSVRISDIGKMKTALELFQLDAGKYPDPTDGFVVTYSGSEVWTQGIFGEATLTNVSKLDKIPTDPLTQKEYTYSVTKTRQEYQFAGIVESDEIGLNTTIGQTNAGDLIATALVSGTYNGQVIKTQSGINCNILSLPSIVSAEPNTVTDLTVILDNESLVYNGYKNLPTNYISSKYKTNEGFPFESKKLIVYDDSLSCTPLYNPDDNSARIELLRNLQEAYSGTLIENEEGISGIVNLDLTDPIKLDIISANVINNGLGGHLVITNNGSTLNSDTSCAGVTGPVPGYSSFDLCTNQVILQYTGGLKNVPYSSALIPLKRDVYGVVLQAGVEYIFETLDGGEEDGYGYGVPETIDTVMYLYNNTGNSIKNDDNGGIGNLSKIVFTPTTSGIYYMGIMGKADNIIGDYKINLTSNIIYGVCGSSNLKTLISIPTNLCSSGTPSSVIDNGIGSTYNWSCAGGVGGTSSSCTANHVETLPTSCTGIMGSDFDLCTNQVMLEYTGLSKNIPYYADLVTNDRDAYGIILEEGVEYTIFTGPGSGSDVKDTYMYLFGSNGVTITSDDDTGILNYSKIVYTPTTTGVYYIGVRGYTNTYIGTYYIDIDVLETVNPPISISDCDVTGQIGYTTTDGTAVGLTCSDDIIVCSGLGTGYAIAACNIGSTIPSADYGISNSYYFQRGRNKGFPGNDESQQATPIPNASYDSSNDNYGFVWSDSLDTNRYDWLQTQNDNLWGITNTLSQGPCNSGYHIPKQTEWVGMFQAGGWGEYGAISMMNSLKLPLEAYRQLEYGTNAPKGQMAYYWSSSPNGTSSYVFMFLNGGWVNPSSNMSRAHGLSVRCFKN